MVPAAVVRTQSCGAEHVFCTTAAMYVLLKKTYEWYVNLTRKLNLVWQFSDHSTDTSHLCGTIVLKVHRSHYGPGEAVRIPGG